MVCVQEKKGGVCPGKKRWCVSRKKKVVCVQEKKGGVCPGKKRWCVSRKKKVVCVQEKKGGVCPGKKVVCVQEKKWCASRSRSAVVSVLRSRATIPQATRGMAQVP